MRKRVLALLIFLFAYVCTAQNVTLTGTMSTPGSSANFTGNLYLTLSQQASVLATCPGGPTLALPRSTVAISISNGSIVGTQKVWGTDCLNPNGVPYNVQIRDAQNNILENDQWLIVSSHPGAAGTFDIGTAVSTLNNTVNYVPIAGVQGVPGPNCSLSSPPGHCDLGSTELDAGTVAASGDGTFGGTVSAGTVSAGTVSAATMNQTNPAAAGNVALKYNSSFAVQYEGPSSQGCSNLNDGLSPGTCVADRWTAWQNVLKANPAFGGAIHRLGGVGSSCGGPSNKMWVIGAFDSAYVAMTASSTGGVLTVSAFSRGNNHLLVGYQLFDSNLNPVGSILTQSSGTYGSTGTYTWTNSATFASQSFVGVPVDDLLFQRVRVINESDGHYINDKGHGTAMACSAGNYAANGSVTSGIFVAGESVTQATTGATGIVSAALAASGPLAINTYTGTSDSTHTWTGATSAAVFTPTGTMVQEVPMLISGTNNYPIEFDYQGQESALSALSLGYDSLTGAVTLTCGITLNEGYYRSGPPSAAGGIPIAISGSVCDTVLKNLGVQGNTSTSKATDGRDSSQAIVVGAGAWVTFQNVRVEYGSLKYNDGACPINANQAGRIVVENSIFGFSIDDRGAVFAPRQFCGFISVKNSVVKSPVNGTDVPVLEVGTGDNVFASGTLQNPQNIELINPQPWSNTGAWNSYVGPSLPGSMTGWPGKSGPQFNGLLINGSGVPESAPCVGTNSTKQFINSVSCQSNASVLFRSPATNKGTAGTAPAQNSTNLWSFYYSGGTVSTVSTIVFSVVTADNSANLYDVGVYGPNCISGATAIPLVAHTGPIAGNAIRSGTAGAATMTVSGAPITANAPSGWYCLAVTSSAASPTLVIGTDNNLQLASMNAGSQPATGTGTTTGATLNSTIGGNATGYIAGAAMPWVYLY